MWSITEGTYWYPYPSNKLQVLKVYEPFWKQPKLIKRNTELPNFCTNTI